MFDSCGCTRVRLCVGVLSVLGFFEVTFIRVSTCLLGLGASMRSSNQASLLALWSIYLVQGLFPREALGSSGVLSGLLRDGVCDDVCAKGCAARVITFAHTRKTKKTGAMSWARELDKCLFV